MILDHQNTKFSPKIEARRDYISKAELLYGRSKIVWFKCSIDGCKNTIRGFTQARLCRQCSNIKLRKRPYEGCFNSFKNKAKHPVTLKYNEFLFICENFPYCEYCGKAIKRAKYRDSAPTRNGFLDRKDNSKGYSKENVVSCCSTCNDMKSKYLTYEEMVLIWKNRGGMS